MPSTISAWASCVALGLCSRLDSTDSFRGIVPVTNHYSTITTPLTIMLPTYINNVLFDLDGTLADTAPDLAYALNQLLLEQGKPALPLETIRPTVSQGGAVMISQFLRIDQKDEAFSELRQRFLDIYSSNLANETVLFPGMQQVLDKLEADNITWGIVTNKVSWLTEPLIRALGLEQRAGCIVSGDTVEHSKPHPAPMLHACQLIDRAPSRTLYVGDAKRDIEAGHNAGMYTLIANYGYIAADEDPSTWGADGMIETPLEILDRLAGQ